MTRPSLPTQVHPSPPIAGDASQFRRRGEDLAQNVRRAARRFATGVTIAAVRHGEGTHALTANSFVTLSLEPALIGIAVHREGRMRHYIEQAGCFGVSILSGGQQHYAQHYARRDRTGQSQQPAMTVLDTDPAVPLVPGCVAYFVCGLQHIYAVGDHDLMVGAVVECGTSLKDHAPLVFLDGEFRASPSLAAAAAGRAQEHDRPEGSTQ
ncbi:flavin reductase family protein [Streptomyces sp. NPDC002994]|uniref:flavin reductase family protein n=1 Tax=Streptomyces sp. NPDC002994 TaxID=3154441 RepID=UPI0033A585B9